MKVCSFLSGTSFLSRPTHTDSHTLSLFTVSVTHTISAFSHTDCKLTVLVLFVSFFIPLQYQTFSVYLCKSHKTLMFIYLVISVQPFAHNI